MALSSGDEDEDTQMDSIEDALARAKEKDILLNPRQYQSQLFEKAKTQNVIACLQTGSGKTLIAVLLLKHMFNEEVKLLQVNPAYNGGRKRMSLFLGESIYRCWSGHISSHCSLYSEQDPSCTSAGSR
jgi:endoribonuclease Dicer